MEITVNYLGNVSFEAKTESHRVVCDQPVSNGGADEGMSPPEFFLVSLGTCAGFYAAQYLRTRSLTTEGLKVRVLAEKATDKPVRLGWLRIEVTIPAGLDERHKEGVMRAVNFCLIHQTLLHPPKIEMAVEESIPVGA